MSSPIVFCIDDRPQLLNLRKAALESQGYCVKTASSGYSALQMLQEMSADVVLLEFKMEGLDPEANRLPYQDPVSNNADCSAFCVLRDAGADFVVGR